MNNYKNIVCTDFVNKKCSSELIQEFMKEMYLLLFCESKTYNSCKQLNYIPLADTSVLS